MLSVALASGACVDMAWGLALEQEFYLFGFQEGSVRELVLGREHVEFLVDWPLHKALVLALVLVLRLVVAALERPLDKVRVVFLVLVLRMVHDVSLATELQLTLGMIPWKDDQNEQNALEGPAEEQEQLDGSGAVGCGYMVCALAMRLVSLDGIILRALAFVWLRLQSNSLVYVGGLIRSLLAGPCRN